MFGTKKKKVSTSTSSIMQTSSRGNMDEYEALRTIVSENSGLLQRVLDKIKFLRAQSAGSTAKKEDKTTGVKK
jgi:hypothetical protein